MSNETRIKYLRTKNLQKTPIGGDTETDKTLSVPDVPADAKATGEAIGKVGLSYDVKSALLDCFKNVAWINVNGNRFYNSLYDALFPKVLPSAYQRVEWIGVENTGVRNVTAYLEIANVINAGDTVRCESKLGTLLGTEAGFLGMAMAADASWEFLYNSANTIALWDGTPHCTNNDFEYSIGEWDVSSVSFQKSVVLRILTYSTDNYAFNGKIKSVKVVDSDGYITHDFVPCYRIADNVIGMYDVVADEFHTNAGTGTFTKGADL